MTRFPASLLAAAEILGAIVVETVETAIDLFALLRLLRAPTMRPIENPSMAVRAAAPSKKSPLAEPS